MALYGSAKAPAVPDIHGQKEGDAAIEHIDLAADPANTDINTAVNAVVDAVNAKFNSLIAHLNDGRV